jgi:hypothetical protein
MSTPDERAFRADVERAPFLLGVMEGRWKVIAIDGTIAILAVIAKDGRAYDFRFDVTGFPQQPPTARLWHAASNAPLAFAQWPRSVRGGRLGAVFRADWHGGTALYLPCDRQALAGHEGWRTQMPSKIWRPEIGIVHYLELVHELLHCPDYAAPVAA